MEVYVDDMLVKSKEAQDHIKHLNETAKIQALLDEKYPTMVKQVQSLTGMFVALN